MAVTAQMVKDLAPELTAQGDTRIEQFIDYAELQVDEDRWLALADLGTAYLTAHMLTVSASGAGGGHAGPVSAEAVGQVSRSFASVVADYADSLGSTPYGREFVRLRGLISSTPEVL